MAISVGQKFFSIDYSYRARRSKLKALQIVEHLRNVHEIEVPETFAEQIHSIHQESYASPLHVPLSTIDAVVDACELFEEYVLNINQLVCFEVLTMVKIHTCVISKKTLTRDLIPVKKDLPVDFQAIVKKNGSITVTATRS